MPQYFKKFYKNESTLAVIAIILTAALTYGPGIPRLGYYHDDWYMLWSAATRGVESLISLFSTDRPFMGYLYVVYYRIIGDNLLGWHLAALVWRIAGGVAFYWIIKTVWPKLKTVGVLSAMLFMVYPGFLSEPIAATKINHLTGFGSALFSIAFTLQAVKTSHKVWKSVWFALSLFSMAFYVWIYEYMVGLEVMRVSLLLWVHWRDTRDKFTTVVMKVVRIYIPYVFVAVVFLFWRVFLFDGTRSATDLGGLAAEYRTNFFGMVLRLIFQIVKDFLSASVHAWSVKQYHLFAAADFSGLALAFLAAAVIMLLALVTIFISRKAGDGETETESPLVFILLGGLITLGAVSPVVVSNRYYDLMDAYKSYGLHPSVGVIILVIGLVLMLKPKFRNGMIIALIGFSVATQSVNTQYWQKYWDIERNLWWQLTWRAPNIQNNTMVMAYLPDGYPIREDYEVWGPVNMIYRSYMEQIPVIQSEVLNQDTIYNLLGDYFREGHVRDIYVPRHFDIALVISQPTTESCIHVIDGALPVYSASERFIVEKAGRASDLTRIETTGVPPTPPAAIFGEEPEHGWCYAYQQAALARQEGDWGKIGEIYDSTLNAGLKPADSFEYFVFVEGLINLGRDAEAKQIVDEAIKGDMALEYSLCTALKSAPDYPDSFGYRRDQIYETVCK